MPSLPALLAHRGSVLWRDLACVSQLEEKTNEFFKHDTDGDNAISFAEFQKQMQAIRPKRREAGKKAGTTSTTSVTSLSASKGRK